MIQREGAHTLHEGVVFLALISSVSTALGVYKHCQECPKPKNINSII